MYRYTCMHSLARLQVLKEMALKKMPLLMSGKGSIVSSAAIWIQDSAVSSYSFLHISENAFHWYSLRRCWRQGARTRSAGGLNMRSASDKLKQVHALFKGSQCQWMNAERATTGETWRQKVVLEGGSRICYMEPGGED